MFSKLQYRLNRILHENHPSEWAGFRCRYSTMDYLHIMKYLEENTEFYSSSKDIWQNKHEFQNDYARKNGHKHRIQIVYVKELATTRQFLKQSNKTKIVKGVTHGIPISQTYSQGISYIFSRSNERRRILICIST